MPSRIFPQAAATAANASVEEAVVEVAADEALPARFFPAAPQTLAEAGLSEALCESLVFKALLAHGSMSSRQIARITALPGKSVAATLGVMKLQQLVFYRDQAAMGDFEYGLTESGRMRARLEVDECAYLGPAPVPLDDYIRAVKAQGIATVEPKRADLERAFGDLLIDERMFERLGPAINSGRGMFLYGYPGNGKSSIAERITDCFGDEVWIPHALLCAGEVVTLFDAEIHQRVDAAAENGAERTDRRWVRIRRPTVVVGGELTMDALEMRHNHRTNVTEAALQLKSNTGTLVIDDFGRQRMSPIELLNRWIVPLEKRLDYLALANGSKVRVPFDQLIIFSTNLEPRDLVDEAFLRRIPYKINVIDPTEDEFRRLFDLVAPRVGVEVAPGAVDHLVARHYRAVGRPFRCCQPRDLLLQVRSRARFEDIPAVATADAFDRACENYFAVL